MQRWLQVIPVALCLTVPSMVQAAADKPKARIAVIIDDVGNSRQDSSVLTITSPLTLAILPHTPQAAKLAVAAGKTNKEVMAHLPMQAHNGNKLGPGGLTLAMTQAEFQATVAKALASLPTAVGVNNHMGSLLTEQQQPMQWLMQELSARKLYFVDSRTSLATVAEQAAQTAGIPTSRRHVFLDNSAAEESLNNQFDQLIRYALKHGQAVAIGHPHPATIAMLKQRLPELTQLGIKVVPMSELLTHERRLPPAISSSAAQDR
ncbi:MAG: divergent polysaccharide deacetylase family protein [Idiomarina sp.]